MIEAHELDDGRYVLRGGDGPKEISSTYFNRDKIKAMGGKWDSKNKVWILSSITKNSTLPLKIINKIKKERPKDIDGEDDPFDE